jgi:hypothetical protein
MTTPTSNDPDVIRADIERTRAELSNDVDALADKVTPSHIAQRQVDQAKSRISGLKETVMGKASDVKDSAASAGGSLQSHLLPGSGSGSSSSDGPGIGERAGDLKAGAVDTLQSAPAQAKQRAQGNPLAAGLVAFGLGWLVSSLLPATEKETQLAVAAKEKATSPEVKGALQDKVHDLQGSLQGPAQDALQSVKETAQEAVENVKGEAQSATADVRDSAVEAKQNVQSTAQEQKSTVTS